MSIEPAAVDQTTSARAPLIPTSTAPTSTDSPVTVSEIAEFLGHLTALRASGQDRDPAARTAFLARKAELFARLTDQPASAAAPSAAPRSGSS